MQMRKVYSERAITYVRGLPDIIRPPTAFGFRGNMQNGGPARVIANSAKCSGSKMGAAGSCSSGELLLVCILRSVRQSALTTVSFITGKVVQQEIPTFKVVLVGKLFKIDLRMCICVRYRFFVIVSCCVQAHFTSRSYLL